MKKILPILAILIIILSSCSSDDDSSDNSSIQINPPNWIQGTWLIENSTTIGFHFTSNDVIVIQSGVEISQRGQLELFSESGEGVSASEESTQNTYKLTSNFPAGQTTFYAFTKVSDTEITWDAVNNSIFTKQ